MDVIPKNKLMYPIAVELTISENQLNGLKNQPGKYICSNKTEINFAGVKYSIGIYPNDDEREGETWIYLFLECEMKVEANFCFKIESANYRDQLKHVFEKNGYSGKKLCTTEELLDRENKYIADGKITIKMEGTLMIEKEQESDNLLKYDSFDSSLCLALWEQENKDFTIVVGDKKITAHKCVLAARSPVFARMFESGMKESQEGKVEIKDFLCGIVEAAVKLCYHHSLVTYTSMEDKLKLLQFFDKYDIQQFKNVFEKYLITVINELTVVRLVNGALLSNAIKLEEKCTAFLRGCLKTKSIADFDLLDKEFALNLLKNAFCNLSDVS